MLRVERGAWSAERDKCYDALTLYAPTLQNSPDARQSLFVRIPPKAPKLLSQEP